MVWSLRRNEKPHRNSKQVRNVQGRCGYGVLSQTGLAINKRLNKSVESRKQIKHLHYEVSWLIDAAVPNELRLFCRRRLKIVERCAVSERSAEVRPAACSRDGFPWQPAKNNSEYAQSDEDHAQTELTFIRL